MAISIVKVAELVGTRIVLSSKIGRSITNEFVTALTNFEPVVPPGPSWEIDIVIGTGPAKRSVRIVLAPFLTLAQFENSKVDPAIVRPPLIEHSFTFFRDHFFWPEREPVTPAEREEIILRTKKSVYDEEGEITFLRAAVANAEAAIEYQKNGPEREPIPDDVKLLVWSRDGGACIRCGSRERLQFDHIIPVAKGGASSADNIQLLCQPCNLRKSDKLAF